MAFPSTFLDLQRFVITKSRVDADADLATGQDLQAVKDWINRAYAKIVITTEANIVSATGTLTVGVGSYTLPPEVARIRELVAAPVGGSYGPPLVETSLDDILNRRRTDGSTPASGSSVSHFAMAGDIQLELWPTPGSADVILFYYVTRPTPLSAGGDFPILQEPYASELLEVGALIEAGDLLKDPDVDKWRAVYDRKMTEYKGHLKRRGGAHVRSIPVAPRSFIPHNPSTDIRYGW